MGYGYNSNFDQSNPYGQSGTPGRSGFSIASMICGICSVTLCCLGPLSIMLGALSILFAALSSRKGERRDSMCTTGIILSCVGMIAGLALTVSSLSDMSDMLEDPDFRDRLDQTYENFYGQDFEEFWEDNYGLPMQ